MFAGGELTQKVYPATGERLLQVIREVFPQVLELVLGTAYPAVPVNFPSGSEHEQIFVTLGALHRYYFPWVSVVLFSEKLKYFRTSQKSDSHLSSLPMPGR